MERLRRWDSKRCDIEWEKLKANPATQRDYLGEGGSLRLWVAKGDYVGAHNEKGQERAVESTSKQMKEPKAEVMEDMRKAVGCEFRFFSDDFFPTSAARRFPSWHRLL
jgi:hypothetical protein